MRRLLFLFIIIIITSVLLSGCAMIINRVPKDGGRSGTAESVSESAPEVSGSETQDESISSESETQAPESDIPSQTETEPSVPEKSVPGDETYTDVDLSIDMPEPNGTMQVSSDPSNKYISIVVSERRISADLLSAVYSVPESGQNYVFEFYSSGERTENSIRRVFFINSSGKIESVCAVKSNEKENISSTENWFSMNVIIKKMIFPAVKDRM
ncbi:MAG: hypothetical protein IJS90_01690 [Clostridia bacterium]|nr:hypothetical protein [Clostridia bacterium]